MGTALSIFWALDWYTIHESGVLRSRDGGRIWESVNGGLPRGYYSELHAIGNTLYATDSAQGIYRFKDGRDTWELVKPSVSNMLSGALTIADGTLYAGMGESGVYRIALED